MLSLAPSPVGGEPGGVAAPRFRSPRRAGGAGLGVGVTTDGAASGWWTVIVVVTVVGPPAGAVGAAALSASGGCGLGVEPEGRPPTTGPFGRDGTGAVAVVPGVPGVDPPASMMGLSPPGLVVGGCATGGGLGSFDLAAFNLSSAAFRA